MAARPAILADIGLCRAKTICFPKNRYRPNLQVYFDLQTAKIGSELRSIQRAAITLDIATHYSDWMVTWRIGYADNDRFHRSILITLLDPEVKSSNLTLGCLMSVKCDCNSRHICIISSDLYHHITSLWFDCCCCSWCGRNHKRFGDDRLTVSCLQNILKIAYIQVISLAIMLISRVVGCRFFQAHISNASSAFWFPRLQSPQLAQNHTVVSWTDKCWMVRQVTPPPETLPSFNVVAAACTARQTRYNNAFNIIEKSESVSPSVCHTLVLCQNDSSYDQSTVQSSLQIVPWILGQFPTSKWNIPRGIPNERGVGKLATFWPLTRRIAETVQDRTYMLLLNTNRKSHAGFQLVLKAIDDLGWPWTIITRHVARYIVRTMHVF